MSLKRPDELPSTNTIPDDGIFIAELNPNNSNRQVVKITKQDLFSGYAIGDHTEISNTGQGNPLVSGFGHSNFKIKSISGGNNISIQESSGSLLIGVTGNIAAGGGGVGGSSLEFSFFYDAINNDGIIEKYYHPVLSSSSFLSGIKVDSASDMTMKLRWDGPADSYVGEAYINGQQIPNENITELEPNSRHFEGYISGLNLSNLTGVTGSANGFTGVISLEEVGVGPTATSVTIDSISNATPKNGENLGSTSLKGGDSINVFADFDTSDVTGIKVYDSGISDGLDYSAYSLSEISPNNYRATIPITVNSSRTGAQAITVIAKNEFGTAGQDKASSNNVNLDQDYPIISASNPANYSGRSDGLREGESTTFINTISNWDVNSDQVLYSGINNDIVISNSGSFENPKTVSYNNGIYSDSDNITIKASRDSNGATDSQNVKVKIANGPLIEAVLVNVTASSASAPHVIGTSEVKGGDVVDCYVYIDGNGVSINQIDLSVKDEGMSDGSQTSFTHYSVAQVLNSPQSPYHGKFQYKVPINVTNSNSRNGIQQVTIQARNNYGIYSDSVSSSGSTTVNNLSPSVSIDSVSYPRSQQAIKNSETVIIQNSASDYDSVVYSSSSDLSIVGNVNNFQSTISAFRVGGSVNNNQENFFITATKTSNGMVASDGEVIKIANTAMSLSILNLQNPLSSSNNGSQYNFNLSSDQDFLSTPQLSLNPSQTNPSQLNQTSSGTSKNSNSYQITVSDSDTKGNFAWVVSGDNLAGIPTTSITTNPNYNIAGFDSRQATSNPSTALGRGLFYIGTTVSNPSNVIFENIAEGGSGPNGGTIYSYQSFSNGTQLVDSMDYDNKFTVSDQNGSVSTSGDYIYNLDKSIRDANASTLNPAISRVEETN